MKRWVVIALLGLSLRAIAFNPSQVDFDSDLTIGIADLEVFSSAWLSHGGPSDDWNPACDLAEPADEVIDPNDFLVLCGHWLTEIPEPNAFHNPADINADRRIDGGDFALLAAAWLSTDLSPNWNPACDIAAPTNSQIDIDDFIMLVSNWLVTVPDPNDFIGVPDLNQDRRVNLPDYAIFSAAWLSDSNPQPSWNSECDLARPRDDRIEAGDFAILAAHWGFRIPDPNLFIYIPGGQFQMGDHHDAMPSATPVHTINVDSFYIGKYPVTNRQYCEYLNDALTTGQIKVADGIVYGIADAAGSYPYFSTHQVYSYSQIDYEVGVFSVHFKDTTTDMSNYPLVAVSWYGSAAYCNWLSSQNGYSECYNLTTWDCDLTVRGFRLATEAQWEYAARGGQSAPYYRFYWGDTIDPSHANYWPSREGYDFSSHPLLTPVGYYNGSQVPAGSDRVNGFGLYDMAGNVFEWCNDWYDANYYKNSPADNPAGPVSGSLRVMRGGSWNSESKNCRVAYREDAHDPVDRAASYGFRVVLAPLPVPD